MQALEKYERRLALRAESTQKNYRSALAKFFRISGLDEVGLLRLAEEDLDEVSLLVSEAMQAEIKAGKKPTTARMIYKTVRFFLKASGIKGFEMDREEKPRAIYNGSRRVTKEQIKELLDKVGAEFRKRNRAIIMFLKDSGIRISDLSRLNVEDFLEAEEIKRGGDRFKVFKDFTTQKTGDIAKIHIGTEAVEALEPYIGDRRTGPLFLNRSGERLGSNHISEIIGKMKRRGKLNGKFDKISAHSLRKFHYSNLNMREDYILLLEGKSTSVYLDDPEDLTDEYIKNYDNLRIFGTSIDRDEAERLRGEISSLKAQLHNLATDAYLDKDWLREQALLIIKESAKELGLDWKTGKPKEE
jgi:integrase